MFVSDYRQCHYHGMHNKYQTVQPRHCHISFYLDGRYMQDEPLRQSQSVHMEIYEIYNELIRDLSIVPGVQPEYLQVTETPERGAHVKASTVFFLISIPSYILDISHRTGWAYFILVGISFLNLAL